MDVNSWLTKLLVESHSDLIDKLLGLKAEPSSFEVHYTYGQLSIDYLIQSPAVNLFAEVIYFFEPCFRSLSFDKLYFIICCLLLEKSVFFVSERLQRTTSAM